MITAKAGVKNVTISAIIRRADGTIEDLGVIAKTENIKVKKQKTKKGKGTN